MELWIGAAHKLIAAQDGHDVVSEAAFGRGDEAFEGVIEIEQALQSLSIAQDRVEWAEQAQLLGRFSQAPQRSLHIGQRVRKARLLRLTF